MRSTMYDARMKALMILAYEKDILASTKIDEIIDNFAHLSDRLAKQLLFESVIIFTRLSAS